MTDSLYKEIAKYIKALQARVGLQIVGRTGFRGVITIEAAMILPIVLIFFVQFISIMQMLGVYSGFLVKVAQVGEETSVYSYLADCSSLEQQQQHDSTILDYTIKPLMFSELYLKTRINSSIKGDSFGEVVEHGALGVTYLGSYYSDDKSEVYIRAYYEAVPILSIVPLNIQFQTFYYSKLWKGYQTHSIEGEDEETSGKYVYIAETGTKYHLTPSCTYLDYDITKVNYHELLSATSHKGGAYDACLICKPKLEMDGNYFVTSEGDKYHDSLLCSSLKRTVEKVLLENVGSRTICSRCVKRND